MATLLPLLFGGLVILAIVPVAALGFLSARDTTGRLLRDSAQQEMAMLDRRLVDHLESVATQLRYLSEEVAAGQLDPGNSMAMDMAMRAAVAATPQVVALGHIRPDGSLRRFERAARDFVDLKPGETPRSDEVLAEARRSGEGSWTAPYWSQIQQQPAILRRMPLRAPDGFHGALVAAVTTKALSQLAAAIQSDIGHTPFVLVQRGRVLAHPTLVDPVRLAKLQDIPRLEEIDDPVLRRIWTGGQNALSAMAEKRGFDGHWNQGPDEADVFVYRSVAGFGDHSLLVGSHFSAAERRRERLMSYAVIIVGALVLALALWISLQLARRLSRPMLALADAADKVERLDLSTSPPPPPSWIAEANRAHAALDRMRVALGVFATYLPATLMRRLISAGAPALQGESRHVTIMFTDLEGYSAFARGRSAEDVAAFLNEVLSQIGPIIEAHGGTIDKYIGDGIMAFWGAPDAMPEHAAAACASARDIATAMREFNRQRRAKSQPCCRLRIGLHTASVVVGNIGFAGRIDYTMVGDGVNIAQRLEQLGRGRSGEDDVVVLMSADTWRSLDAAARLDCEGPIDHASKEVGVAYRLLVTIPAP